MENLIEKTFKFVASNLRQKLNTKQFEKLTNVNNKKGLVSCKNNLDDRTLAFVNYELSNILWRFVEINYIKNKKLLPLRLRRGDFNCNYDSFVTSIIDKTMDQIALKNVTKNLYRQYYYNELIGVSWDNLIVILYSLNSCCRV